MEVLSYDSAPKEPNNPLWAPFIRDAKRRRKRSLFWWPGSADAGEVFEKSGSVILTNGYVHEHLPLGTYFVTFSAYFNSLIFIKNIKLNKKLNPCFTK
jgi:hypothetical protein